MDAPRLPALVLSVDAVHDALRARVGAALPFQVHATRTRLRARAASAAVHVAPMDCSA
jgi:hypothetical protein